MKALVSAYRCNPNEGGEQYRSWMWIHNYLKEGYEVVCLTNKWDKNDIEKASVPLAGCKFVYLDIPDWIEKIYVNRLGVYAHYLLWQHYAVNKAKNLHNEHHFDFVHHTSYGSPYLGSGMWRLGIPFIYGPLGGGQFPPKAFKKYFYKSWKLEMIRLWISGGLMLLNPNARASLRHAKLVMTENHETLELAKKHGAGLVKLFYDGGLPPHKLPESLVPLEKSHKLRILWVGRLLHMKGLPLALEALSRLSHQIDFEFTIIGDGPFGQYLPKWLKEFGLEDKINWMGQVPWQTVMEHYQKNDVFLFCSLRESSGSQLFEAMAYGLPIVTLNHFGARSLMPNNVGIKVSVESPEQTIKELVQALLFFQQHEEERATYSNNAFLYIRDVFSNQVNDMVKNLRSIVAN